MFTYGASDVIRSRGDRTRNAHLRRHREHVAAPGCLVHGFPDTPYTWRHLGPELVQHGYRVVAPLLPGYGAPVGKPISVGTYARAILQARRNHQADDRAVLIGHDWGAIAGYGAVASDPAAFTRFVALAAFSDRRAGFRDLQLCPTQAVVLHLVHPTGGNRRSDGHRAGLLRITLGGLVTGLRPCRRRR